MQPAVQLVISMMADGNFTVQGPLANKALCRALLAAAEQIVADFKGEEHRVVPVAEMPLPYKAINRG